MRRSNQKIVTFNNDPERSKIKKPLQVSIDPNLGFCFGVRNAYNIACSKKGEDVCILGELIHNEYVTGLLKSYGISSVGSLDSISSGSVIIRSHGEGKQIFDHLSKSGKKIIDATCPYVSKIHKIVSKAYKEGFQIVIAGSSEHSEVRGINGWCENSASVVKSLTEAMSLKLSDKVCLVSQTTFSVKEWKIIRDFFIKLPNKTVEVFDTICYTTNIRQQKAVALSQSCNKMLVIGSCKSSNTTKLLDVCKEFCKESYLIQSKDDLSKITFTAYDKIGITAGASAHDESIQEVLHFMGINSGEFGQLLNEESLVSYSKGTRIKGAEIISADANGVVVKIGGKNDGYIAASETMLEGDYNPADFAVGSLVDVMILGSKDSSTGLIPVSKKEVDAIKLGDKAVEGIRNGEVFTITIKKNVEKGLVGKLGNYRVFVPQSQVGINFVRDLNPFINKKMNLIAIDINDETKKIVASAKAVLEAEKKVVEEEFFSKIFPDMVVEGKVVRSTPFGAFVVVEGYDCLAHITDLAWHRVGKVEDILKIGETYEFLVLACDREKGRVSLGYKQLHLHPFDEAVSKYPVGTIVQGKVVRLAPFGAFVEIEKGLDGLVHISEASYDFVKNINDALKVGDEVSAMVTKIDAENRKISLSIKAAAPAPTYDESAVEQDETSSQEEIVATDKPQKVKKESAPKKSESKSEGVRKVKTGRVSRDEGPSEWSEGTSNTPLDELLKNFK